MLSLSWAKDGEKKDTPGVYLGASWFYFKMSSLRLFALLSCTVQLARAAESERHIVETVRPFGIGSLESTLPCPRYSCAVTVLITFIHVSGSGLFAIVFFFALCIVAIIAGVAMKKTA